jgi:glycosyltransferase involved in cell wall biosynthesis
MKITFITPNLEMHGGNLVMLKYANYLVKKGNLVTIISSDRITLKNIDPIIKILTYKAFPVRYVDFFLLQKIYFNKIINLINDCDVLIPIYTPLLPIIIRAKNTKKLKANIIFLFQDFFEMIWVGRWIKKMLSNPNITKNIKIAICVSLGAEMALKSVTKLNTIVIPNGIETEYFYPRKIKKEQYLLFVGRPGAPKGFSNFKGAVKIVKNKYPKIRAKVIASGVENDEIDGIQYIKYRDREQLAKIYNRALIYVNSSPGESFGLPALEAMASGTAVVVTDTVGSRQYAINGTNCLVIPVNNPDKLSESIIKIIEDKKLREKLQNNALKTVKKYSWDKSLKQFEKLLLNLD